MNSQRYLVRKVLQIVLPAFLGFSSPIYAEYFSDDPPSLNTLGELVDDTYAAKIQKRVEGGSWSGEKYLLTIETPRDKTLIEFPFESSYGRFRLYLCNITDSKTPNIVLVTASGKGTSVAYYDLDIFRIEKSNLKKIYSKRISEYYGPGERWWYGIDFIRADNDLDQIELALAYTSPSQNPLEDTSLIPVSKKINISWNPQTNRISIKDSQ